MRVGVVAMGYADGYPRQAPTGTPVMVAGQRSQLIGRVSMDMLCIDLTDVPQAGLGSPVELWGKKISSPVTLRRPRARFLTRSSATCVECRCSIPGPDE
ncbi:alanine racemase C-terminal domain-containing protein [Pseudomonas lini]